MAILGLQGVRGGVGTTSLTAALAWALQILGENVLVIDASPDNLLRMSFNVDFVHQGGWARSLLDGQDWRDAGLRYTSQLDLLPFGQLTAQERENPQSWQETLGDDAPRDKRTYFREINYIAAAFQYQKKNYKSA